MFPKVSPPEIAASGAPAVAFHFLVSFYGIGGLPIPNTFDIRFQKITGIEVSIPNLTTTQVGGKQVRLPSLPQYSNLTLTRGYLVGLSPLRKEMEFTFESLEFCPRNMQVFLLDTQSIPVASWLFFDAFPVKWSIGDLDATSSAVLIETMEISYSHFQSISL